MKYCSKCGAENKKDNLFCKECGEKFKVKIEKEKKDIEEVNVDKVEVKEVEDKKVEVKDEIINEETTKKKKGKFKIIFIIVFLLLLIGSGVGAYIYLSYLSSPEYVANTYIQTIIDKDYEKIYEYIKLSGDTTFVGKDLYIDLIKDEIEEKGKIVDYDIDDVYFDRDENVIVEIEVMYKNSRGKKEETVTVELEKGTEKKYMIFDSWTIVDQSPVDIDIVYDYEIYVPEDSTLTFSDIEVDSKYIEESEYENMTVYKLPQVFEKDTTIEVELNSGINIEREISPSSYYDQYKLTMSEDDITADDEEKLEESIKEILVSAMKSVGNKEDFDEVDGIFSSKHDLDDLKYEYQRNVNRFENYGYVLTDFKVDEFSLRSLEFSHSFLYVVEAKIDYSWTGAPNSSYETNEYDKYDYITFYLSYEDGSYKLVDINRLPSIYMLY